MGDDSVGSIYYSCRVVCSMLFPVLSAASESPTYHLHTSCLFNLIVQYQSSHFIIDLISSLA